MEEADKYKHGRCIADMNNNYLSCNEDLYPKSVVWALTYLSHFSDGENKKEGSTGGISFAQYTDNRTCYRCGEKQGTYCNQLPTEQDECLSD